MLDPINVWLDNVLPTVFDDSLSIYEVLSKIINTTNELIDTVNSFTGGVTFTPSVSEDGIISWTNDGGLENPESVDIAGPIGPAGPAPSITVMDILGGHRITITDEEHPTGLNIDVMNGAKGDEGISPNITINDITNGHKITITDKTHPSGQSFDVLNGEQGEQGNAGISPAITITDILGGHRITITDATHPSGQSFNVWDGANGAGVPAGGEIYQRLIKNGTNDYDAAWASTNIRISTSSFSSFPFTINNNKIKSNMSVINCVFSNPENVRSNVDWATADGTLTLNGSLSGATSCIIDLVLTEGY